MYFMRARYYDPTTGRFIARDPVAGHLIEPQTQNSYAYSIDNPINFADPSGEDTYGGCIAANAGLALFGTCSACMVYNTDNKQLGATFSLGGGLSTGLATGVGIQSLYSTAKKLDDLKGQDIFGGWSAEVFGADTSVDKDNNKTVTTTAGPSLGPDVGLPFLPFEVHAGSSYTWVAQ